MSSSKNSPDTPDGDDDSSTRPAVTPASSQVESLDLPESGHESAPDESEPGNLPQRLTTGALIEPAATLTRSVVPASQAPVILTIDPSLLGHQAPPPRRTWTAGQLIGALLLLGVITIAGGLAGFLYGGGVEPTYGARSEFIYFLEDAVPDGFLREDRRILTQLVTIESDAVLRPIAQEFDTTVTDLRKDLTVDVVDLSEVIRLDVENKDADTALGINAAILASYQATAEESRLDDSIVLLTERRAELLEELELADLEIQAVEEGRLGDVALESSEESLTRQLTIESDRLQRLNAMADDLLTGPTIVDDSVSINSQISTSRATIASLQQQLLGVRTQRGELQQRINNLLGTETAFQAGPLQSQDVVLSVQEDSLSLEIDTVAERLRRLESLRAESLINTTIAPNRAPIAEQIDVAAQAVSSLEAQILAVREQRAQLGQTAATLPSVTRRITRLEQDLVRVEQEIGTENLFERSVSPIEVLAQPFVLEKPVGNPRLQFAALGFIAAVPLALIAVALVRLRSRRR